MVVQPSLDNAYLRVKWAKQKIGTLRGMEKRLPSVRPNNIVVEPQPHPVEFLPDEHGRFETEATWDNVVAGLNLFFGAPRITAMPPPRITKSWSKLFGETIDHLRGALDYLVYALAYLDSGQPQKRTQFPICDTPAKFQNLIQSRRNPLIGIAAVHVAAIEDLQPYDHRTALDPKWLARLREFSNPHKHEDLTVVASSGRTITTWTVRAPSAPVEVNFEVAYFVSLGDADQTPLIPTLDSLLSYVAETLDVFRPEF